MNVFFFVLFLRKYPLEFPCCLLCYLLMKENFQTAVHWCSSKQVFLKILQYSQESVLKPLFNKVSGLKACIFIQKETPTQVFFCEYCEVFKKRFLIEDLFIIPFWNFCLIIDNGYFRVTFYYCKIRPYDRKNFAIDRSKFVFRYLIISLLQRFVSSSNCKEKMVALNWTILVSNFSKYI